MKKTKKKFALLLLGLVITTVQAQQGITVTGGSASGSGGTAAYSVGQVFYTTSTGTGGSVAQGMQQAYEIATILGLEERQISLNMVAYPNPTTDYLTLSIGNTELSSLRFQLYDGTGKLIESKKITSTSETIEMGSLASALYFLKVVNNNKEVKTFKIFKK
jgi:hypothetical protein